MFVVPKLGQIYRNLKSMDENKLAGNYYLSDDVVQLAREFLGKQLHSMINGVHTSGKIVEVEAYCGAKDRACHAFPNKRTPRTETMYLAGGVAYVYLVYGMHHLFNIVTNRAGHADAVLVRAIEPIEGLGVMMERRKLNSNTNLLTGGPARLTQALGITIINDREALNGDKIWLTEGELINHQMIQASTRIGVEYAGEDALLPWRFSIRGNKYVSK